MSQADFIKPNLSRSCNIPGADIVKHFTRVTGGQFHKHFMHVVKALAK